MENTVYINDSFSIIERNEKVNAYAFVSLQEELMRDEISCAEVERLCYLIVSNLCDDRPLVDLQNNNEKTSWYDYLKVQLYLFVKKHDDYANDSTLFAEAGPIIVSGITDNVFQLFGVDQQLVSLIASFLICVVAKMSVRAWCDYFYNNTIKGNEELEKLIVKVEHHK